MTKRQFIEQYVLNAALGAGYVKLNVEGAIAEAQRAWTAMQSVAPTVPVRWRKPDALG